jgi:hypothetical protein
MQPTQILIETAREMGEIDHVSVSANGRLFVVAYPPRARQFPIPERLDNQQAWQMLSEAVKFVKNQ